MVGKADKRIIEAFAKKVRKDFSDAKIILFGSRAKEEELLESDYDILIVSKSFEGINFFKRTEKMYDYWNRKQSLEALCYTPEEFRKKSAQLGIVQTAIETGVKI